jgi:hypothetical protein
VLVRKLLKGVQAKQITTESTRVKLSNDFHIIGHGDKIATSKWSTLFSNTRPYLSFDLTSQNEGNKPEYEQLFDCTKARATRLNSPQNEDYMAEVI